MFNRLEFVISEAFVALFRNRLMTIAAVTTVAVALFLFGGLGFAYFRISQYAQTIPGKFNMMVYLRDEATKSEVSAVAAKIRALPGVANAFYVPKEKAWERWKQEHPTGMTEGVENPLPEGFKVVLSDLKESDAVVASIKSMPEVAPENGVQYLRDEQNLVESILVLFRYIGIGVGGILMITAGLLIYNAIRLTVLSRRLEIRIMQLVGASRAMVHIPFLIEGMLQGIFGAMIASLLVIGGYFGFNYAMKQLQAGHMTPAFPYVEVVGILCAAGALYGIFCSMLAVRVPLKYR